MTKRGRPRRSEPLSSGIYYIFNTNDGHLYIGSSNKVEYRLTEHRSQLRAGKHPNKRLQQAWKNGGADAFVFSLLTEVQPVEGYSLKEVLEAHEGFWIQFYRSDHPRFGYNDHGLSRSWLAEVFDWGRAYLHKRWATYYHEWMMVDFVRDRAQSYYTALPAHGPVAQDEA